MGELSVSVESKRTRISREAVTAVGAVGLLASLIGFLILRYAVAIPMLDDWEMVPPVIKAHQGQLTFADLFSQQQESRTIIPKLVFIALSYGRYWDSRAEMILSVAICCLTALGLYRLIRQSGLSGWMGILGFVLSVVLIFSPAQHEIWLLASGFPSFLPAFCIVWGVLVATGSRPMAARYWICVALAACASFTLSNGLLAWGLTFPLIFFADESGKSRMRWLGYWFVAIAVCAAIYFWNFRVMPDLPAFAPRKSVFEYCQYIAAFLGSGLGRAGNEHPLTFSTGIGSILLLGYAAVVIDLVISRRDAVFRKRILPWLALGGYSIGSGCLAALGRIEWGVAQALESRYVAFSIYLAIALVIVTAIYCVEFLRLRPFLRGRIVALAGVTVLLTSFFALESFCAIDSIAFFRVRSAAARIGESAVLFELALDTSKVIKALNYPRPDFVRKYADALDQMHLLRTPLVRTPEIAKLRHGDTDDHIAAGWCDSLTTGADGLRIACGWAALPARHRPADAVVLAYANERGEWIAFALSDAVLSRPDVARTLRSGEQLWSGWRAAFAGGSLPANATISAWGLDAKEAKLYRLRDARASGMTASAAAD